VKPLPCIPGARSRGAFTLVELIAVLAIMAMAFGLAGGMFYDVVRAQRMTEAASQLQYELQAAAQMALRDGESTYVELVRSLDDSNPLAPLRIRGFKIVRFEPNDRRFYPMGEARKLPIGIIMSENRALSSALVNGSRRENVDVIGFTPEGYTTLKPQSADDRNDFTLTLVFETDVEQTRSGDLPKNCRIILINPRTGSVTTY
jgi:uncharacterized protein (TIGR02596 family)